MCLLLIQCSFLNIEIIDWLFNSVLRRIGGIRATHDSAILKVNFRAGQCRPFQVRYYTETLQVLCISPYIFTYDVTFIHFFKNLIFFLL